MMPRLRSWLSRFRPTPRRSARRSLELERLEDRAVPAGVLAVGSGAGVAPQVLLFHDTTNDGIPDGAPYAGMSVLSANFRGGVRVAVGHFTDASNLQLVVAAGPGGTPMVQVFQLDSNDMPTGAFETFFAVGSGFNHGLFVARAHSQGAAFDSLVVTADAGGIPFVRIYNDIGGAAPLDHQLGNSLIDAFIAFGSGYRGGVRPAAGRNLTAFGGDFLALATGPGITARVMILRDSNNNLAYSDNLGTREVFLPFGTAWTGGIYVAMGNVGSPSTNPELIVSRDAGGNSRVLIFSDSNLDGFYSDDGGPAGSFLAYSGFTGGVRVAYSRLSSANFGQVGEVIVMPVSTARPIKIFKSQTNTGEILNGDPPLAQFFLFGGNYIHGYFAAFGGNGT
jgi:hypothetical protein